MEEETKEDSKNESLEETGRNAYAEKDQKKSAILAFRNCEDDSGRTFNRCNICTAAINQRPRK